MMKPFLIALIILTLLSGCKQTHCPGFPDYLLDYLPYSEGDVLLFKNSNSDTLSLEITHSWASDSYSYKWNEKGACEAGNVIRTGLNEKHNLKLEGTVLLYPKPSAMLLIDFYNNDYFCLIIDDIDPFKKENEYIFGDTIIMENETTVASRIPEIMIVKGVGIIYFVDKQEECAWVLIE
ncbi:MAG: hypothetical protein U9R19_04180 [Bacteroidota bacterium]|nr:hypothetical protein [Bacteroidota bacterium]